MFYYNKQFCSLHGKTGRHMMCIPAGVKLTSTGLLADKPYDHVAIPVNPAVNEALLPRLFLD